MEINFLQIEKLFDHEHGQPLHRIVSLPSFRSKPSVSIYTKPFLPDPRQTTLSFSGHFSPMQSRKNTRPIAPNCKKNSTVNNFKNNRKPIIIKQSLQRRDLQRNDNRYSLKSLSLFTQGHQSSNPLSSLFKCRNRVLKRNLEFNQCHKRKTRQPKAEPRQQGQSQLLANKSRLLRLRVRKCRDLLSNITLLQSIQQSNSLKINRRFEEILFQGECNIMMQQ